MNFIQISGLIENKMMTLASCANFAFSFMLFHIYPLGSVWLWYLLHTSRVLPTSFKVVSNLEVNACEGILAHSILCVFKKVIHGQSATVNFKKKYKTSHYIKPHNKYFVILYIWEPWKIYLDYYFCKRSAYIFPIFFCVNNNNLHL